MFGGQAVLCACLGLLFRLPRRVPFASVQKEPKDSPRHPAPAASRLGCPRCIVAPGGTPPRSFVDRGGSRGILPLVPLRNDSARPPDGAGLPPHHLEGKPHFVDARNPIRRADTAYGGIRPTGLHGNERRRLAVLLFLEFLSCLYGSELRPAAGAVSRTFLSCLYGSEPLAFLRWRWVFFLAAYTAVNKVAAGEIDLPLFLAAYTAVNLDGFIGGPLIRFLAAYTAVNSSYPAVHQSALFLAAYTAVNASHPALATAANFLAAYTAVNVYATQDWVTVNFLAAYTAVNALPLSSRPSPGFLAAYTAVN
ncbi:Uncharacterised protein [Pseudomonas aeruginosa]|nr:Uncharacterised protein [Pseudomonas aeruginosa]